MKIKLTSVMVDDQEKALKFYTEILGFVKKTEIPMGEHKWLTVVNRTGLNYCLNPWALLLQKPIRKNCSRQAFRLRLSKLLTFNTNMKD